MYEFNKSIDFKKENDRIEIVLEVFKNGKKVDEVESNNINGFIIRKDEFLSKEKIGVNIISSPIPKNISFLEYFYYLQIYMSRQVELLNALLKREIIEKMEIGEKDELTFKKFMNKVLETSENNEEAVIEIGSYIEKMEEIKSVFETEKIKNMRGME